MSTADDRPSDPYSLALRTLEGQDTTLGDYRGKVLLIVNVASHCGYTPQYQGLEMLHRKLSSRGLSVLGFPCNQFGAQEPGDADEIRSFCSTKYDVTFPIFEKIDVNGPDTHPLYRWLKSSAAGILGTEAIKWNFTKFLVDRQARRIERFAPSTTPESLEAQITSWLDE